ncbi:5'/3'-nucleotidase SurE [Williamsia sp. CHRR-6]|uniref:5'/3'-nucleotidase SurE n=1 Tax=Williamsia sp. CHRR-6 TaxID=2835871 RepID=UPI001BDA327F|nr:5'/3'-nucleotidase SurE [Williamsia sp. CHRR-6]MBT0567523.1 5'/3'-nucleotidase SurE [Williamsia sp. CHRR-6]
MSVRILLTNDDGWDAPGISALRAGLRAAGHEVTTVAPADNQSGAGTRVASQRALRVERPDEKSIWAVHGSPADSVIFGLSHVFADGHPDVVISGANNGANAGQGVHFSGTVGAALCATTFGVPSIAVSTDLPWEHTPSVDDFDTTTRLINELLDWAAPHRLVAAGTLLNINVPAPEHPEPLRLAATHGDRNLLGEIAYREAGGVFELTFGDRPEPQHGSDLHALRSGWVSLAAVGVTHPIDETVTEHLRQVAAADLPSVRVGAVDGRL